VADWKAFRELLVQKLDQPATTENITMEAQFFSCTHVLTHAITAANRNMHTEVQTSALPEVMVVPGAC